jgi:3-hydroxymyristoyl/3-hydroxydecanoyl-(acyl carrier protein) dehydratase
LAVHHAECEFAADEPSARGHFPGNPIIPGAVLLREVVRAVAADNGMVCSGVRSARFFHPVRPGDRIVIAWEEKRDGEFAFTCSTASPDRRVLAGTLGMRQG